MSLVFPDTENMICLLDFGKSSRSQVPDLSGNNNHGVLSGFQETGEEFKTDSQYGQVLDFSNSANTRVEISKIDTEYKTFLFLLDIDEFYAGSPASVIAGIGDVYNFLCLGDIAGPFTYFAQVMNNYGYSSGFNHERGKGLTAIIFRYNSITHNYSFFCDGLKFDDDIQIQKQAWQNINISLGFRVGYPSSSYLGKMKMFGLWQSELDDQQCIDLINSLNAWSPKAELLSNDGSNDYFDSKFESGLFDYDLNGGNNKCFVNENGNLEFTNTCWLWNNYSKVFNEGTIKFKPRKKVTSPDQFAYYFVTGNKINNAGSINGYAVVLDDANSKIEIWKNGTAILSEDLTIGNEFHEIELTKSGSTCTLKADGITIGTVVDSDITGNGHECCYCVAGNWEIESYEIKYS